MKVTQIIKAWFNPTLTLGQRGERRAAQFLRKQGMKILTRNVRTPRGEIDIVALDKKTLVIVEVRTQSDTAVKRPEQSIRDDKKRHVLHAAHYFIRTRKLEHLQSRIDVVAIVWPPGEQPQIKHFINAFRE